MRARTAGALNVASTCARAFSPSLAARSPVGDQPPQVAASADGVAESSPVLPWMHDVARAAGVHRGNGDAECGGLEQHAAERFRPVRRKHEHRRRAASTQARARAAASPGRAHRRLTRGLCFHSISRSRPSPTIDKRPAKSGVPDDAAPGGRRPCWSRACRHRARRARDRPRALASAARRMPADVHRVRNLHDARVGQLRRARLQVGGHDRADGDHRIGACQTRRACARRFARMYGMSGHASGRRARRGPARIASCWPPCRRTQAIGVEVVDEIRPVADRPVVAHRRHDRHAGARAGTDRRAPSSSRAGACTMSNSLSRQAGGQVPPSDAHSRSFLK